MPKSRGVAAPLSRVSSTRRKPPAPLRNGPLDSSMIAINSQLAEDNLAVRSRSRVKAQRAAAKAAQLEAEERGEEFVPEKLSRRILDAAREQQMELDEEDGAGKGRGGAASGAGGHRLMHAADGADDVDDDSDDDFAFGGDDGLTLADGYVGQEEMGEEEEALLQRFMNPGNTETRRNLADLVMEGLQTREAAAQNESGEPGRHSSSSSSVDPRVANVFAEVGKFLAQYRSGRLPKVLKLLPGLSEWEELLMLTEPDKWTPHAVYAVTRVFASNLNALRAQRFFNMILLPAVRDDIAEHKKLNYHLYQALRKALYKPPAFFKGLLLPLAESGNCTLQEARIVGSALMRKSVPQMHSAAAIMRLALSRYNAATSILLSYLINKKYALPYRVVDALRYKCEVTREQKEQLRELIRVHSHHAITPEVRRELFHSPCRGEHPDPSSGGESAPPAR